MSSRYKQNNQDRKLVIKKLKSHKNSHAIPYSSLLNNCKLKILDKLFNLNKNSVSIFFLSQKLYYLAVIQSFLKIKYIIF